MPGGLRQRRMDSYLRIEIIGFGLIERQVYVYRESNGQKQPLFLIELAIDWHMNLAPQTILLTGAGSAVGVFLVQKHTSTILKGC
jgi:hypothetical protein